MPQAKLGFVFPGQGSQYVGMGKELCGVHEAARKTFQEADEALGFKLSTVCFEGPEETLKLTENTQPAILAASIAVLRACPESAKPLMASGHSLGEYSALVAAGSISFPDALRLVRLRGRFMQEAVPVGRGAMAAVLGVDDDVIVDVCGGIDRSLGPVSPANFNSPGQVVISGAAEAVAAAGEALKSRGAKRIVPLPVSAPFHCALMEPAARRLAEAIGGIPISAPAFGVVSNVTGRCYENADQIRSLLVEQVVNPVRWVSCVNSMSAGGVRTFVELGPGKVLTNLVKRIDKDAAVSGVDTPAEVSTFAESLGGAA